jgi:outer membrane protein assembly factor BamB
MKNVGQSNVSSLQAFTGSRTLSENGWNFNTMGDSLVCSNATNGSLKWKIGLGEDVKRIGGFLGTAPIKVGKHILVATYNGDLLLIDSLTGETVKKFSTNQTIRTAPIAMNGWIYVGTTNGKIIGINTQDGHITGWPMLGKDPEHSNGGV